MNVIVYSSTGCPQCNVLKMRLTQKGIQYEVCDDIDEMERLGIKSIPVLSVDGRLMNFPEAFKYVNER